MGDPLKFPRPPHIDAIMDLQVSLLLIGYIKLRPGITPTQQMVGDVLAVAVILAKTLMAHTRGLLVDRLMHYWQKKELALDDD